MGTEYEGLFLRHEQIMEDSEDVQLRELLGKQFLDAAAQPAHRPAKRQTDVMDAPYEPCEVSAEDQEACIPPHVRRAIMLVAMVVLIGLFEYFGLMDALIAVPGMCICSGCAGWYARCTDA